MARSLWKGPFTDPDVLSYSNKISKQISHRVWSRRSTILPQHVDLTFEIHTGRIFIKKQITPKMVGLKFGELAMTRKVRRPNKK